VRSLRSILLTDLKYHKPRAFRCLICPRTALNVVPTVVADMPALRIAVTPERRRAAQLAVLCIAVLTEADCWDAVSSTVATEERRASIGVWCCLSDKRRT